VSWIWWRHHLLLPPPVLFLLLLLLPFLLRWSDGEERVTTAADRCKVYARLRGAGKLVGFMV
jgi:hypothetical protein